MSKIEEVKEILEKLEINRSSEQEGFTEHLTPKEINSVLLQLFQDEPDEPYWAGARHHPELDEPDTCPICEGSGKRTYESTMNQDSSGFPHLYEADCLECKGTGVQSSKTIHNPVTGNDYPIRESSHSPAESLWKKPDAGELLTPEETVKQILIDMDDKEYKMELIKVSTCCEAEALVSGTSLTHWYTCSKCTSPCDVKEVVVYELKSLADAVRIGRKEVINFFGENKLFPKHTKGCYGAAQPDLKCPACQMYAKFKEWGINYG